MSAVPPLDGLCYRDVRRELSVERRGQLLEERATKCRLWGCNLQPHPTLWRLTFSSQDASRWSLRAGAELNGIQTCFPDEAAIRITIEATYYCLTKQLTGCMLRGLEAPKPCMLDELIKRLKCEYLAPSCEDHLFHIFTTNAETSSADAGDDLIFWVVCRPTRQTQFSEVLNAGHLIPSGAVIFGNLRFNDNLRVKLARNNEIGRLIEPLDTFRPLRLRRTPLSPS